MELAETSKNIIIAATLYTFYFTINRTVFVSVLVFRQLFSF